MKTIFQAPSLPIPPSPREAELVPASSVFPQYPNLRVLVVDDEPLNREIMVHFLRRIGAQAAFAEDGFHAIEAVRTIVDARLRYDLILMDIQMPGLNGVQTTSRICALERDRPARKVALTAHVRESDYELFRLAGFDEILVKPLRLPELFGTLDRCAAR